MSKLFIKITEFKSVSNVYLSNVFFLDAGDAVKNCKKQKNSSEY